MTTTRSLNMHYLWFDSLCLIQYSLADWQAESTDMTNIYRNGVCNIATMSDSENSGSLSQKKKESITG
ncbi:hypothetical protein CC78DRAFT_305730 [Lojkania enalia]|uniref:Heterokaryon incompatibility domain-containing protein n=1 Tax=Lojkania enalia TaxID=147567 RepID=A0A9P4N9R5_9PLEO|nr:hypothetical protein CC78DRAFT_305730 [Didymosphaeria enalia]